jgi:hypothetical protein
LDIASAASSSTASRAFLERLSGIYRNHLCRGREYASFLFFFLAERLIDVYL